MLKNFAYSFIFLEIFAYTKNSIVSLTPWRKNDICNFSAFKRQFHEIFDTVFSVIKTHLDSWFIVWIILMKMFNILKIFLSNFNIWNEIMLTQWHRGVFYDTAESELFSIMTSASFWRDNEKKKKTSMGAHTYNGTTKSRFKKLII